MSHLQELITRNYNPETDAAGVEANLRHNGCFREGQDSRERLAYFVSHVPDSVIVATQKNRNEILGNVYATDGMFPIIGRLALARSLTGPRERLEVTRVLYNAACKALRLRGARHVEVLHDWPTPRAELAEAGMPFDKIGGFVARWDVYITERTLVDNNGISTPDIPPSAVDEALAALGIT